MDWTRTHGVALSLLVVACGDDPPPIGSGGGSDTTAASTTDPGGSGPATSATTSVADGTGTTGAGPEDGSTDEGTSTTTGEPPWDGEPLPDGEPGEWQWVDVEGTECIDGSPTGVGVRYGEGDGLVVYFEGGGGCFDFATCSLFYASFANFDENAFDLLVPTLLSSGIFADVPGNPVRDWSFVYVPYCTGDVHAGARDDAEVPGFVGSHQFVGYRNFGLDLERIGPTFADPSHVLVTGISAGGYGAAYNYDRIATAYGYADIPVTLLDDSGPPMSDEYIAPCLQEQWRDLWSLDDTLPAGCAGCFDAGGWALPMTQYVRAQHPEQTFGLLSNLRDGTIRTFLSGGLNDCIGGLYLGPDYEAGLVELRDDILGGDPGFGTYYVQGIGHTFLPFGSYESTQVSGTYLVDWIDQLLQGNATHVAP